MRVLGEPTSHNQHVVRTGKYFKGPHHPLSMLSPSIFIFCREKLAYDSGRSGKEPWSMHQYRHLYNCCRIPGLDEDKIRANFKTGEECLTQTKLMHLNAFNMQKYTLKLLL